MKKTQAGFTLIELVVVIVLLGILGVTALGKFQDLSGEAETAAMEGIASELSSGSTINYAKGLVTAGGVAPLVIGSTQADSAVNSCNTAIKGLLASGTLPSAYKYTIVDVNGAALDPFASCSAAGDNYYCAITKETAPDATALAAAPRAGIICTAG